MRSANYCITGHIIAVLLLCTVWLLGDILSVRLGSRIENLAPVNISDPRGVSDVSC